jgi:hypothetical protein
MGAVLAVLVALLINQIPRMFPKDDGMISLNSEHFVIWYMDADKRSALELKTLLEDRGMTARKLLGLEAKTEVLTEVYLYPDRQSFERRRWGEIGRFVASDDSIVATERGPLFMVLAPRALQEFYDRQTSLTAGLHAYIRSLMTGKNIPVWVQEGIAYLLADGNRDDEGQPDPPGPDLLFSDDAERFARSDAPEYIDSFIAWLCTGPEGTKVISKLMAAGDDPFGALKINREQAWMDWTAWLRDGRLRDPRLFAF